MRPIPYKRFKHVFCEGAARHGLLYASSSGKWHQAHVFKLRTNPRVQCTLVTQRTRDVVLELFRLQRRYLYSYCEHNEAARIVLKIHMTLCSDGDLDKSAKAA